MAKKAKSKATKAPAKTAKKTTARATPAKGGAKYDQAGAPWWKKFRPTVPRAAGG